MSFIEIGKLHFHIDHLKDKTLDECVEMFKHVRPDLVKMAWKKANPKTKSKKKTD